MKSCIKNYSKDISIILSRDKKYKSKLELLHVIELITTVITESLNSIINNVTVENIVNQYKRLDNMRIYYNNQILNISHKYKSIKGVFIYSTFSFPRWKRSETSPKWEDSIKKLTNKNGKKIITNNHPEFFGESTFNFNPK